MLQEEQEQQEGPKIFWTENFFGHKIFFDTKLFLDQTFFPFKKIFGLKIFQT